MNKIKKILEDFRRLDTFLDWLARGIVGIIFLVFTLYIIDFSINNEQTSSDSKIIKTCEELCTYLCLTIEDYYQCCEDCYNWESKK